MDFVRPVWSARLGSEAFFNALESQRWDLVCLHGAYVADHKSLDFPVLEAVASNTAGIGRTFEYLGKNGNTPIIWTGTYFEANEGQGTEPLRNFSPYALSKQLSWEFARFHAEQAGLPISKFVMPNPFGPWEGKGFTTYLARTWLRGEIPSVQTPDYIRDNCPIDLLALFYCQVAERSSKEPMARGFHPSGYSRAQGAFADRFSHELEQIWSKPCPLQMAIQTDFPEPRERRNTQIASETIPHWDEKKSWRQLAAWYQNFLVDL
jgi:nucleoside-diphosphate-sugar epimerase